MEDEINRWFVDHDGDGDFAVPPTGYPYSVVPPPRTTSPILYTTKPESVLAALSHIPMNFQCGVIGRVRPPRRG